MAGLADYLGYDDSEDQVPITATDIAAVNAAQNPSPTLQKYLDLAAQTQAQEQGGINQLQQYISEYQAKPQGVDWTPLASVFDAIGRKPGNSAEIAAAMRPQTEEQRQQTLMTLQDKLQNRRGQLSKNQLESLAGQLKMETAAAQRQQAMQLAQQQFQAREAARAAQFEQAQELQRERLAAQEELNRQRLEQEKIRTETYKQGNEMKKEIALLQLGAAKAAKESAQERADARQQAGLEQKTEKMIADQTVKIGKELSGELPALSGEVKKIEELLGGSLDAYDPKTKTLNGKVIDVPGKSVPGIGRMYMPGSQGEEFDSAFKGIFNSLLKQRSGAAVTNQELARLRSEFAAGRFNTEEKMIEAMSRFKKALRKEMLQKEKSFKPEAVQRFKDQGGLLTEDLLGMEAPPPEPQRRTWQGKTFELQGDTWVEVK